MPTEAESVCRCVGVCVYTYVYKCRFLQRLRLGGCVCVHVNASAGAFGGQKGASDPLELELEVVVRS